MDIQALIQKHNNDFSTYYAGDLYTHTPMALVALKDLGATKERILEFYKLNVKKLVPKHVSKQFIDESNWGNYLGDCSFEASYVQFFKDQMQKKGLESTLEKYFDRLMVGVGAAAFHPLIRLSYALKENNVEEVIYSLATWASSFLDLKIDAFTHNNTSVVEILKKIQDSHFNQGQKIQGDNIADRMLAVAQSSEYHEWSTMISLESLEKYNLEKTLLWMYAQTNNFTLLHAVTSHHAFEYVLTFSKNKHESKIYYWKSLLAAYLSTNGVVSIDFNWEYPSFKSLPSWKELKESAVKSNDDHVIKLVYILNEKKSVAIDDELRYASALKLGMIKNKFS